MTDFFPEIDTIPYAGPDTDNPLAFRWYDADRVVRGRTMRDHLRFAVCYWHSFNWDGFDIFGDGTLDRPWLDRSLDPIAAAERKMDVAFEFFAKLGTPFWCFHDFDIAPEGATFKESAANVDRLADRAAEHQQQTGVELLWGTAKLFANRRYMAGAATNPDPEVFAYAAGQVAHCMDVTHRLGGHNYVLWGGREGYDTLLNTDMARELDQLARFLHLAVEHKHRIGFQGTILIEPKPFEPTKHQYDYDSATVFGFLQRHGLEDEIKVNIEVNHATLSGHDFAHEIAVAANCGIFGSIDANAGDDRLGWDLDRFPVSVEAMSLGMLEILRAGGFTTGGLNFDCKLRRQSIARDDLFRAHIGGIDTMARALLVADALITDGELDRFRADRYAGWDGEFGQRLLAGELSFEALRERAESAAEPQPVSGRQEHLENLVNRYLVTAR
ncbi:xylose isomerase [Desertimonas flava]|uniref:xylose isomerase n=1 Tax=Desertimonas flava TaxID=2064846 RepID=UPI000E34F521|nr:xylose isomerase [Desertimonas flava]